MTSLPKKTGRPKIMAPRKHGPDFSAEKTWAQLSKNIREIQKQNASNLSFEENHRFAYNMVLNKHGDTLYRGVKQLVAENLDSMAQNQIYPVFPSSAKDMGIQSNEDNRLLHALTQVWQLHTSDMERLGQILKYMDRVHTKTANVPPTHDLGLELFLKHIMKPDISEHFVKSILNQILHEREGYTISRSTVKGSVGVYLSIWPETSVSLYKRDLEPEILKESESFYRTKGEHLINSCDAPTFLKTVEDCIIAEDSRAHHYLSGDTSVPLLEILKDNLLSPHIESVISKDNSGLDVMLDDRKFLDLSRLYNLFSLIPSGLPCLKAALKESIVRRGKEINDRSLGETPDGEDERDGESTTRKDASKGRTRGSGGNIQPAIAWVDGVLALKDKIDEVWKSSFQSNREVESAVNGAFEKFINANPKCSEFISLYIDDHLKKGLKGKTEIEVDAVLDKTITLFRFIMEKDVFEKYYKGHLAKRLLHNRSISDDAERGMLSKLKVECGVQFTQKMEGMFNDMKLSAEATREYRDHIAKIAAPNFEISVIVMTSNAWPMNHSSSSCLLPAEMGKACESFKQFYLSRHSGRRLTWQYSLGNADVKVRFADRVRELSVATFALVILLLFQDLSDDDTLAYSKIKEMTEIEDSELRRHLQSLACGKFKILKKHPPGRDIDTTDSFSFHSGFTHPLAKIKVATVSSKLESNSERRETLDRIDEERKHVMEACIVRIMKDRKHMAHVDLVHEVTAQLTGKFLAEPFAIKKRVEHLIEREYLERCEDRKSYNYLA